MRQALLFFAALALSLPGLSSAQDRVNRIRSVDAVLTVHSDGTLDVTEELTVQLAGSSKEIARDLSLQADGAKRLDVQVLAVTDEDGQPLRTEEASTDSGWTKRLRIWIPGAGDADRRIAIRYRVTGAIRPVNTGRKVRGLYAMRWKVTGNVDTPIDSVHARIVIPPGARSTRTTVYAGPTDSPAPDATIGKNGNDVSFPVSAQRTMTLRVGLPSGFIQTKRSLTDRLVSALSWWPFLIPVITFAFAFRAWDKTGRDPKEESQVVRYEPVEGVSPAALGRLASGERESPMRLFTATLVDLAVRGFLRIEETTPNILLTLTKDVSAIAQSMLHGESGRIDYIIHFVRPRSEWKGLKWHEERLLDGLVNAASSVGGVKRGMVRVSMLWNKFYVSVPEITEAIEFELVSKGYYRTRPGGVNVKWIAYAAIPPVVGGIVAWVAGSFLDIAWVKITDDPPAHDWALLSDNKLLLGMLLGTIILIGFGSVMPSRSVAGARAREAALGFKEFLRRVDTMPSVELFERYLPYAIAFGVEDSWARAFENVYVAAPTWYSGPMGGKFSATSFGARISDLCISAESSMAAAPSESGKLTIRL